MSYRFEITQVKSQYFPQQVHDITHKVDCPLKLCSLNGLLSSKLNFTFQNANSMDGELDLEPVTASRRRN